MAFWAIIAISSFKVWLTGVYIAFLAFMPPVFVYFLIRASVRTEGHVKGLVYLLIALNVFLAVNGIVQYHTGIGLGDVGMVLDRIYGTGIFNDPNDLGMTFVMAVPFVMLVIGLRSTGLIFRIARSRDARHDTPCAVLHQFTWCARGLRGRLLFAFRF